jgi:hypothetical protein
LVWRTRPQRSQPLTKLASDGPIPEGKPGSKPKPSGRRQASRMPADLEVSQRREPGRTWQPCHFLQLWRRQKGHRAEQTRQRVTQRPRAACPSGQGGERSRCFGRSALPRLRVARGSLSDRTGLPTANFRFRRARRILARPADRNSPAAVELGRSLCRAESALLRRRTADHERS